MKTGQRLWTRDELILTINLYCKLPFGKLDKNTPAVIELAELLGRTNNAVAYKLVNFASLDPSLQARGIKGAVNTSKLDKEVWNDFFNQWDVLPYESEVLLAKIMNTSIERINNIDDEYLPKEGKTREVTIQARVNQSFFRNLILSSYNYKCCITGLQQPEFLIAGHIKPWSIDEKNRVNPRNGIAINALHDKAFENGLITITPEFKIKISSILKKQHNNETIRDYFIKFDDETMILPSRFLPDEEFLKYHNNERFID